MPAQAGATSLNSCTCLPNFVNTQPESPAVCECGPGYGFDRRRGVCEACPKGFFKTIAGNSLCSSCEPGKSTLQVASRLEGECLCRPGLAADGDANSGNCSSCLPGFFCNGTGMALACQEGATSPPEARSPEDCICQAGRYRSGSSCELCPRGRYKLAVGDEGFCPLQCPTNADCKTGSADLAACFCGKGYFAELDSANMLSRCASCATLPNLHCPGGFRNSSLTPQHALPSAKPGFFQTGVVTVYKCSVLTEDGSSACMGAGACDELGSSSRVCIGKFGNICAEGSAGMLCGQCPPNWARQSLQSHCQPCFVTSLELAVAVLADVSTKAIISFVVASMAATAAVRGNGKLHTSMIRQGTQWVAACTVLTVFQLDQVRMPFSGSSGPGPSEGAGLSMWPEEVSAAMADLFQLVSLGRTLVSVNFAAQCYAQELLPTDPAAETWILGLYYMCLPLLLIVATVLLCAAVVYVLVPFARRFGRVFNEVGRRQKERESATKRLRSALEDALLHTGLHWEDVLQSGALTIAIVQLHEAVDQPDLFLRRAVVASPALLAKACAARAVATKPAMKAADLAKLCHSSSTLSGLAATYADDIEEEDLDGLLDVILEDLETAPAEDQDVDGKSVRADEARWLG